MGACEQHNIEQGQNVVTLDGILDHFCVKESRQSKEPKRLGRKIIMRRN
jgi:hypothetical protein